MKPAAGAVTLDHRQQHGIELPLNQWNLAQEKLEHKKATTTKDLEQIQANG